MSYKAVEIKGTMGFGTMSMTWTPTPPPTEKSIETLKYVTGEKGVSLLNGGEFYGSDFANLKLIKKFLDSNEGGINSQLVIGIKGALNNATLAPDGSKESVVRSVNTLTEYFPVDMPNRPKMLFEIARVDPNIPYEDTIGYIADFVKEGKIDGISLSEVGLGSIAKACNVFPISCVELELSLLCQDLITNGILQELSSRQIPIVAYSPLCRGLLTDSHVKNQNSFHDNLHPHDMKNHLEKFSKENYGANMKLVNALHEFAHQKKKTSLESLSLSWIVAISGRSNFNGISKVTRILPIPSGSSKEKIDNNLDNIVELTDEDLKEINEISEKYPVQGLRYNAAHEKFTFA
ncbi:uncharacterized protein KQ657_002423 [Scheffersomyces spartinae]|uniref:NADP-dependent oxidoreductase domain-containing protein n=1 Tax=Scheffersomyces spartinae TaxID=45513 RepID=A0A9P7V6Z9_9ASCO|nr:uncharacterized protein KQ657_002423 [Scheffersomyces spartinae]KAG7192065.1 hypothetical protein KQ657_002423 [Scheffersomyces spartinae]